MARAAALLSLALALGSATADPISSAQGLITRLLGAPYATAFSLAVIPADPATGHDVYELGYSGGKVTIAGNTGVAISAGLHWYLKYTVNASFSWGRDGSGNSVALVPAPSALPPPATPGRFVNNVKWVYYANVCTFGYSLAWYGQEEWQAEIDRLALWGVNTPLSFLPGGQEVATRQVFMQMGLTAEEVDAYISGPAFLPWQRMGNMQGWGGPTPADYWARRLALQQQMLAVMRDYGMTPVLPGFSGHVPANITRIFPNANVTHSKDWCAFPAPYGSDTFLEPTDELYVTVGAAFNKAVLQLLGDPTGKEVPIFNADQYNEMTPNSEDDDYLKQCNAATYQAMTAADPRSLYIMQGWLFHESFWTQDRITAYLSGVPQGKLIVLDLNTEAGPVYQWLGSTPWVWNALSVYGGRRGLYGALNTVGAQPLTDLAASSGTMVGIGITPEAIDQCDSTFQLLWENAYRPGAQPLNDTAPWVARYAARRYGVTVEGAPNVQSAWAALLAGNLNTDIDTAVGEEAPNLGARMSRNGNTSTLLHALRALVAAAQAGELPGSPATIPTTFSYDLTDMNRQLLWDLQSDANAVLSSRFYAAMASGNLKAAHAEIASIGGFMLNIIAAIDAVCAADPNFLLGQWTELARASTAGGVAGEEQLVVFGALNQITLWGPTGQIRDYASKNGWAGLVSGFYLQRWTQFVDVLLNATVTGVPPDWNAFSDALLAWEEAWGTSQVNTTYPTTASGASPVALAVSTLSTYAPAAGPGSGYVAYPDTDGASPPQPPANWVTLGAAEVAVGNDCPFLTQGPTDSLAACKAACQADNQCNELNVLSGGTPSDPLGACVMRTCQDPLAPQLTPYPAQWTAYGLNRTANTGDITQAWVADPGALAALCDADPSCAGFNSNGWLKTAKATGNRVPSAGTTLWVKKPTSPAGQAAQRGSAMLPTNPAGLAAAKAGARPGPALERSVPVLGRTRALAGSPPEARIAAEEAMAAAGGAYGGRGTVLHDRAARGDRAGVRKLLAAGEQGKQRA